MGLPSDVDAVMFLLSLLLLAASLFLQASLLLVASILCRGSCFFGYTAENSHHLKARIISKDPLFQEEKIPARKQGRCQVNSEKSSKN